MIYSMTGYGKAEKLQNGTSIAVEIRSLNNRYLDLTFKGPRLFLYRENEVKEFLKKKIERGKISLTITVQSNQYNFTNMRIDHDLVKQYVHMLREASDKAGIGGEVKLEHVLGFSDIFSANSDDEEYNQLWKDILEATDRAIDELNGMRRKEGEQLSKDLIGRVQLVENYLDKITELAQNEVSLEFTKLQERLAKLLERTDMDPQRLQMEIAVLADKVDITEELVRFRSHNKLFVDLIHGKETQIGRKLNFIAQEMGREANTIGSKSSLPEVIHTVVSIKEELEKLREQIQNVE